MEAKLKFDGEGGTLAARFFLGLILTVVTCGLFWPWLCVSLMRWTFENMRVELPGGEARVRFDGTGWGLFKVAFLGGLLTVFTLGLGLPWVVVWTAKWFFDNTSIDAPGGGRWSARFEATGGEAFPVIFGGLVLTVLTFGIYGAWFACNLTRWVTERLRFQAEGAAAGEGSFAGTGGDLLVTGIVGGILTSVTFGLFAPWLQVALWRFFSVNLRLTLRGAAWTGDFTGAGWPWFKELFFCVLFTILTLGIYLPWAIARQARFRINHTRFLGPGAPTPAPSPFLGIPGFY